MCYMYVLCFSTWYVWLLLETKKQKKEKVESSNGPNYIRLKLASLAIAATHIIIMMYFGGVLMYMLQMLLFV